MKKYYSIFSQKLMSELVAKGYALSSMRKDENGSGRNVFYFRDTPELRAEVKEYQNRNK